MENVWFLNNTVVNTLMQLAHDSPRHTGGKVAMSRHPDLILIMIRANIKITGIHVTMDLSLGGDKFSDNHSS